MQDSNRTEIEEWPADLKAMPYADFVMKLAKSGQAIIDGLTPLKAHLWHMATGVGGEAGELEDVIKKHVVYGKELDRENVVEELGDLMWFMTGIKASLGITDEEIEMANKKKLATRYQKLVYSDHDAHTRRDKGEQ